MPEWLKLGGINDPSLFPIKRISKDLILKANSKWRFLFIPLPDCISFMLNMGLFVDHMGHFKETECQWKEKDNGHDHVYLFQ